jgi:hypothetical protein
MPTLIIRPALAYLGVILALGFVLGTCRTLWLAPLVGPVLAVACELPVLLGASWWWSARVLRRWPLPTRSAALAMGALAFALLMVSELALANVLAGQSATAWLATLTTPAGALGLAGQAVFAAIPALRWRQR